MYDQDKLDLARELHRLRCISKEVIDIIRRDATLFARLSRRTKRWIKTQDRLAIEEKDAKDVAIRLIKRRQAALAKLTDKDKELLGLNNLDADEDTE
jgi:hypothetical protein